jgi:hypothetical protein
MMAHLAGEIMRELVARGYAADGTAPNGTMDLDQEYMVSVEVGDLLDLLVGRREKIFRSVGVVGQDTARKGYDDVVVAIDAVKAVIARLVLP